MMFALALLLATSQNTALPAPLIQLRRQECPAPMFDRERGYLGDRAIISDDGTRIVVQCGDGIVRTWQSGMPAFKSLGVIPLFRAAREQGIVATDVRCPWPSLISDEMKVEADCDILDHNSTSNLYVLSSAGGSSSFLIQGDKVLLESRIWQKFGALLPGKAAELAVVDSHKRPELLQKLSVNDGRTTAVTPLPSPNLLFEDGEGDANAVVFSAANQTVIVSFGGSFRVARDMTYVRAFDTEGREKWKIGGKLPPRGTELIVGDYTRFIVFAAGRYALFAKSSNQTSTEIIDLRDGNAVSTIRGWPIAAAREASVTLIKDENGTLSLIGIDVQSPRN